ncbi:MAG TPA: D-aminoacyl-tRNA deacylase, partial [Candidatus Thermoplasmatota archaeon]|nr:D-aminoacyl-tRNA deacylase [Candidatus Thermoplasmatota archaeon]
HQVTYEATHHGPGMGIPTLFVEIGSDESWYRDPKGAAAVADAITDVLGGEGRAADAPVLLGLGGGHYVPRATDLAKAGEADFGHLLPVHALEAAQAQGRGPQLVRAAAAATPGCTGAHLHHKSMGGGLRRAVAEWCAEAGVPVVNA